MDLDLTASATPTGPHSHHAPVDPTLPKPWRSFVDGTTGYLYFWNPETNVTQYERPIAAPHPLPTLEPALVPRRSLVQMEQPSGSSVQGWQYHISADESSRHNGGHSHGPKQASLPAAQNLQDTRGTFSLSQNDLNGSINTGYDGQPFRSSAGAHGPVDVGVGSSPESYRDHHEITVIGRNVPAPFMTIESTGFPLEILEEARHTGFSAPTSIQAQSWPIALQSRDILAVAKMALGKTLSYLIPGFIHLKRFGNNNRLGPRMMVLSPTRELAIQIQDDAVKFGRSLRISCTCLYGGVPKGPQLRDLDQGTDIVVATPGRLNDILEMRRLSLHQVSYLVVDEADRVMDMGFEPLIRKIVREIPTRRQTLMYTGVLTREVYKLAADLLFHPVQVNIGVIDNPFPPLTKADESVAPLRKADEPVASPGKADEFAGKKITQYVEVTRPMAKTRRLEQILKSQEPGSKVIVFCSNKKMCDSLAKNILRKFGAASIKSQDIRDRVLNQFQTGKSPILVATDVAVQGLDVNDIRVVINFDFPTGIEDYIHRVSMADSTGVSYTFFCDQDAKHASDLIRVLEGSRQEVPADLRAIAAQGGGVATPRRWGSSAAGQEGGSSQGSGHNDSNNDASAGLGTLASGSSSSAHDDRGPSDRYDSM